MYQRVSTIFGVGFAITVVVLAISSLISQTVQAGVKMYRCQGEDGQIAFRQFACASSSGDRIEVESPKIGFKKPRTPKTNRVKGEEEQGAMSESRTTQALNRDADARQRRCWKARKMQDRLQRQLRKGYRPAEGERLRSRRNEQDEYLRHFCR